MKDWYNFPKQKEEIKVFTLCFGFLEMKLKIL